MNLLIESLLPCRKRAIEVEQELGHLIEMTQREIKRREVMAKIAERASRKVREGAPPSAVLREIARLQRLMRDEHEEAPS